MSCEDVEVIIEDGELSTVEENESDGKQEDVGVLGRASLEQRDTSSGKSSRSRVERSFSNCRGVTLRFAKDLFR